MPLSKHGIADPPIWGHKSSLEKQFMWPQGNAQDLPVVEASLGFCIQCAMTQFEPNDFWFQTNSFVHPLKHQLFRPRATALMKADEGKTRQDKPFSKSQARAWIDMGSCSQPPPPPCHRVSTGSSAATLQISLCLSCGSKFLKLLAAITIFLQFSKLHTSLWIQYLL